MLVFVLHAFNSFLFFFSSILFPSLFQTFDVIWWCLSSFFLFISCAKAVIKQFPFMGSGHQSSVWLKHDLDRKIPVSNCAEWMKIIYALWFDLIPLLGWNDCHITSHFNFAISVNNACKCNKFPLLLMVGYASMMNWIRGFWMTGFLLLISIKCMAGETMLEQVYSIAYWRFHQHLSTLISIMSRAINSNIAWKRPLAMQWNCFVGSLFF